MRHAFGPCVLAGSVVSIRAELSKQADATYVLKISLALDGEGLGEAFEIEGLAEGTLAPLYPLVSFSGGPSAASIARRWWAPASAFERQAMRARTSIEGD
mmetsp:Transcript_8156/g.20887  ORF Transcript_8156/g.20887 Transcript_8156/m.20887 type:complete len:100 (+) Transcript_8156:296-595(+)